MKYRKKPVVIEAEQWRAITNRNVDGVICGVYDRNLDEWIYPSTMPLYYDTTHGNRIVQSPNWGWINTLEGGLVVRDGDWVITGVQGEKHPCNPDIFNQTYEQVEDSRTKPDKNMRPKGIITTEGFRNTF